MQLQEQSLPLVDSTLNQLITELSTECQNVNTLLHQLNLPKLTPRQKAEILAELLASAIHLQAHCGEEFQSLIAQEMEKLPDDHES